MLPPDPKRQAAIETLSSMMPPKTEAADLFDRSPRSVTLTEEGRRFHTQVMTLLPAWRKRPPTLRARQLS